MERYTSCLASLSPCGKCDSKDLVFFQLDLYTVWGSFIVNRSPYNTQKYFLPEFCIHKSFWILTLLKLKSTWFSFLQGKKSEGTPWRGARPLFSSLPKRRLWGFASPPQAAAGWAAVSLPAWEQKGRSEKLRLLSGLVVAKGGKN